MATIINQTIGNTFSTTAEKTSITQRFMTWAKDQERNRLLWVGLALAGHGCIITPLTVMAVLLAGTNLFLFILALVAMGASLVTNLAAMPTKVTIPVFFLSILVDLAIIISCIAIGMDITKTYI